MQNFLELRGVGIIDVMSLYGARAVKDQTDIDLTIYLEPYEVGANLTVWVMV